MNYIIEGDMGCVSGPHPYIDKGEAQRRAARAIKDVSFAVERVRIVRDDGQRVPLTDKLVLYNARVFRKRRRWRANFPPIWQ